MDDLGIKIKNSQQIIAEKEYPPPKMDFTYILSEKGTDLDQIQIICQESVLLGVHNHAISSSNEVGGVLIGDVYKWDGVYYVKIDSCIQGTYMETGPAHARFTADTWAQAMSLREKKYPDKVIVGWYHSHPSLGIFLSGMDLGIHRGFFTSPWHVALVFDAQKQKMGFFTWENEQIRNSDGFSLAHRIYHANCFEPHSTSQRGVFEYKIYEDSVSPVMRVWLQAITIGTLAGVVLGYFLSKWLGRKSFVSNGQNEKT